MCEKPTFLFCFAYFDLPLMNIFSIRSPAGDHEPSFRGGGAALSECNNGDSEALRWTISVGVIRVRRWFGAVRPVLVTVMVTSRPLWPQGGPCLPLL